MKKDVMYIVGGLAVGAVVFYAFKDKILKKKSGDDSASEGVATSDVVDSGATTQGGSPAQPASEAPPASQGALPYVLLAILYICAKVSHRHHQAKCWHRHRLICADEYSR